MFKNYGKKNFFFLILCISHSSVSHSMDNQHQVAKSVLKYFYNQNKLTENGYAKLSTDSSLSQLNFTLRKKKLYSIAHRLSDLDLKIRSSDHSQSKQQKKQLQNYHDQLWPTIEQVLSVVNPIKIIEQKEKASPINKQLSTIEKQKPSPQDFLKELKKHYSPITISIKTVTIQKFLRQRLMEQHAEYLMPSITIQNYLRGYQARTQFNNIKKEISATIPEKKLIYITILQSFLRGSHVRKQCLQHAKVTSHKTLNRNQTTLSPLQKKYVGYTLKKKNSKPIIIINSPNNRKNRTQSEPVYPKQKIPHLLKNNTSYFNLKTAINKKHNTLFDMDSSDE